MIRRLTPLALALALPAQAQAPSLTVWPYVGNVSPTSATLSWATSAAGASEVRFGPDASLGTTVAATDQTLDWRYFHSATLTGLQPDTTYTYRIYTAGSDLSPATLTFRTAPATTATSFTFGAMGDGRGGGSGANAVATRMAGETFDLVIHTGDFIVDTGCAGASGPSTTSTVADFISQFFSIHKAWLVRTPFYGVMGNHEMGSCGPEFFTQMFANPGNERYYSFDWANAHFVGVDVTQSYGSGSAQYTWLDNDLKTSTKPWKFVFFHYPAYSSGSHGSDATVQSALIPLFEKYGVDLVFNGHDHTYERTVPILSGAASSDATKAITYVVSGGAGAPLYNTAGAWFTGAAASKYHYMKIQVLDDCRLQATAIDSAGAVFDTFTLDRGGCSAPSVPTGLRATAGDASVDLNWNANPDPVSGYNVKRSTQAGDPNPPVLANLVSGTSYRDGAVTNGSTYYYALSAVNGASQESANSAAVSATPNASAPVITSQPASKTVTAGQTATFSVTASGSTPLAYQWRKNAAALAGATASSYTTPATTVADSGSAFDVVVSNAVGSVTSSAATLTVNPATSGSELIQNGGFESGTSPWTASSSVQIGTFAAEPAYEGSRCAWMGGKGATVTQSLYQTVSIPSTATKATLSFYLHVDTAETTTSKAYDTLKAYLVKATSSTILKSLGTFSNLSKAPGYQLVSYDVTAYKGQTLRVYFQAKEDSSAQTSFVLDKVSLAVQ
ncbi:MAG: metallophosphoesterase [Acidobacteria bacterium]|nr:metallophosphoesterase [Acidobacteriota bacterium]